MGTRHQIKTQKNGVETIFTPQCNVYEECCFFVIICIIYYFKVETEIVYSCKMTLKNIFTV